MEPFNASQKGLEGLQRREGLYEFPGISSWFRAQNLACLICLTDDQWESHSRLLQAQVGCVHNIKLLATSEACVPQHLCMGKRVKELLNACVLQGGGLSLKTRSITPLWPFVVSGTCSILGNRPLHLNDFATAWILAIHICAHFRSMRCAKHLLDIALIAKAHLRSLYKQFENAGAENKIMNQFKNEMR